MSWFRRFVPPAQPLPKGPAVGIGALVAVVSDPDQGEAGEGDPVGVVVASGDKEISPYPGLQRPRYWTVAFEGAARTADGRGPFEQASFPEWRLRVLDADAAADGPGDEG
jgi:hypothetical protein